MTLFLSFRERAVAGGVTDGVALEGDGAASVNGLKVVDWYYLRARVAGRNVLFAVHGFNINMASGACSFSRLDQALGLSGDDVFIGVLWPGDFWIPVVNYPFEGSTAIRCGQNLAARVKDHFGAARSLSFVSHSLGARLVLEAVKAIPVRVRMTCLMAGAINRDCLQAEYLGARDNAQSVPILASYHDLVLKLAFRIGDPIADLLHDDHRPFEAALGYSGPPAPVGPPLLSPWQIPDDPPYGHGDYLPSGDPSTNANGADAKWSKVAQFIREAFRGQTRAWPP